MSASRATRLDDAGFVMVALLVSMAVTAVWMGAALPAWRRQVQREKEAELIFRGEAIARAVYLYRQKNGQSLPPSLDVLVNQRFLRQKYLDPITGKDFLPVAGASAGTTGGRAAGAGALQGGIIGVRSTSNETSVRIYNNQQTYSQWAFDFTLEQLRAGGGPQAPGSGAPGRGGQQAPGRGAGQGGPQGGFRGAGPADEAIAPITPPGAGRGRPGTGGPVGGTGGRGGG